MKVVYIETSAVLRAIFESGLSPELGAVLSSADILISSRLSLVESARAVLRARLWGRFSEAELASASRQLAALWSRCHLFELTPEICAKASEVAPLANLRTLDALHLATFLFASKHFENLTMLSVDRRILDALGVLAPGGGPDLPV
ncbi:MAG: type II toxin-antitoxin system VapC family toxin [Bradymonadales bacterium]|nr:type II toxin-antitoxin system VapC family toxin [Bradymonadales bacterium]